MADAKRDQNYVTSMLFVGSDGLTYNCEGDETTGRLKVDSNGSGGTFVGCSLIKTTPQALTTGVYAAIAFESEDYDTDSMHSNVTNNSRITINTAGRYLITGAGPNVVINSAVALKFRVNGTDDYSEEYRNNTSLGNENINIILQKSFAANDYIELMGMTLSGSYDAETKCLFAAYRIG